MVHQVLIALAFVLTLKYPVASYFDVHPGIPGIESQSTQTTDNTDLDVC